MDLGAHNRGREHQWGMNGMTEQIMSQKHVTRGSAGAFRCICRPGAAQGAAVPGKGRVDSRPPEGEPDPRGRSGACPGGALEASMAALELPNYWENVVQLKLDGMASENRGLNPETRRPGETGWKQVVWNCRDTGKTWGGQKPSAWGVAGLGPLLFFMACSPGAGRLLHRLGVGWGCSTQPDRETGNPKIRKPGERNPYPPYKHGGHGIFQPFWGLPTFVSRDCVTNGGHGGGGRDGLVRQFVTENAKKMCAIYIYINTK